MDINCTDSCQYQKEGKCTLNSINELPNLTQTVQSANCLYQSTETPISFING